MTQTDPVSSLVSATTFGGYDRLSRGACRAGPGAEEHLTGATQLRRSGLKMRSQRCKGAVFIEVLPGLEAVVELAEEAV